MTPPASSGITLLDEEVAVLVPDAWPLPWLDGLSDEEHDAALRTTARGLLLRGLAVAGEGGLAPAEHLAPLLEPLRQGCPQVQVLVEVVGADRLLSVLHLPSQGPIVVQDVSEDGVHVLREVEHHVAVELLQHAVDPLRVLPGPAEVGRRPGVADAVVRLRAVSAGRPVTEVLLVTSGTAMWSVDGVPVTEETRCVVLGARAAERLVDDLLGRPSAV